MPAGEPGNGHRLVDGTGRWPLVLLAVLFACVVGGCAYQVGPTSQGPPMYFRDIEMVSLNVGWAVAANGPSLVGPDAADREWILRTWDSGRSWAPVLTVPLGSRAWFLNASEAWVDEVSGPRVLTILSTNNGGQSWQQAGSLPGDYAVPSHSSGPPYVPHIEFVGSKHGWLFGCGGAVFVTEDGGKSWFPGGDVPGLNGVCVGHSGDSVSHAYTGLSTIPVFVSPYIGWAVRKGRLFETTGGGFGWTAINLFPQTVAEFPMIRGVIRGVFVESLGASGHEVVVRLSTLPREPQLIGSQPVVTGESRRTSTTPNCLPAMPSDTVPVAKTLTATRCLHVECSILAVSSDGGKRWRFSVPGSWVLAFARNPSVVMAEGGGGIDASTAQPLFGQIVESEDGSLTWSVIGAPRFTGVEIRGFSIVDVLNSESAWAVATLAAAPGQACPTRAVAPVLVRTTDSGKTWELVNGRVEIGGPQ